MIIICGVPNAGKTTYSQQYKDAVHYDSLNMTTRQRYIYLNRLARRGDAVFDGVFGEGFRRKELVKSCPRGEKKICVWLNTPLEVCLARENRDRSPEVVLFHWQAFEPPTMDEGWDRIEVIEWQAEGRAKK